MEPTHGKRGQRLLSSGPLGRVYICPGGCLHVDTGAVSLRYSQTEYQALVQMLSEAATQLSADHASTVH